MQVYAPYQYPEPKLFEPFQLSSDRQVAITARYHHKVDNRDVIMQIPVTADAPLLGRTDGALLIDLWSNDEERDWLASTVFVMNEGQAHLDRISIFGDWRLRGLFALMIVVAQELMGWSKTLSGLNQAEVW